ncbi:MAG: AIR synthase-related protein [Dehalococcoidia bacterium]|nr:AIR synthase-related protein [Dehalococcoidia bacterium]
MGKTTQTLESLNAMEKAIVDVYWSDHCRHITFNTPLELENSPDFIQDALKTYQSQRQFVHGENISNKPITLMDLVTISMKEQKKKGTVPNLIDDKIEENAATRRVMINGKAYRISFKNETHNSPTEIGPYDGGATCTGGLQRDLLASRGCPYQGMRITGAADPTNEYTMPGKLPQRQITTEAAAGFSYYATGLGLTTGYIHEIYHPDYVAKRMELGWGASVVDESLARIEDPIAGDQVFLIGGRTGRDGIGGATGSSQNQDEKSLSDNISQVPAGVPELERQIIKLYCDPEFLKIVKKSNDFGAGGVSVAVGEIASSLDIYLDRVPLKEGQEDMSALEIAISESQERMAIVTGMADHAKVVALCDKYGLEVSHIADVSGSGFLNMYFKGEKVVSLEREFLKTPFLPDTRKVYFKQPDTALNPFSGKKFTSFRGMLFDTMTSLENCSQQGLAQMFDQVDKNTVLRPYDGKKGKTKTQGTVCLVPVDGNDSVVTIAAYGYDPYVAKWSTFYGGQAARLDSIARVLALGGDYKDILFTDQEYYASPITPEKLGAPFAALLGANYIAAAVGRPAVGGKDSMSGSYKDIDVPPTLVSFALAEGNVKNVKSQAFQKSGSAVGVIFATKADGLPLGLESIKALWDYFITQRNAGNIISARAIGAGGIIGEVVSGVLGNDLGFKFSDAVSQDILNNKCYGSLVFEIKDGVELDPALVCVIGHTTDESAIQFGDEKIGLAEVLSASEARLAPVFPVK